MTPGTGALATAERSHASQLGALTGAKLVSNTALRWIAPFLPTLERAFGVSTSTITSVMGVAELGGLSTTATGPLLDRGRQRWLFLAGTAGVGVSSVVALGGSIAWFAVAYVVLVVGVSNLTVAGHAWISERVPYASRARWIGIFETSWALALLCGSPLIALSIDAWGWRAPFVALAIASALAAVVVARVVPPDRQHPADAHAGHRPAVKLPRTAWPPLLGAALTAAAGLSMFVVSGAFLEDRHDVSTGGLGLVAMGFGALELVASGSSAALADRWGKRRSVAAGMAVLAAGLAVTATSGESLLLAVVGLTTILTGFEFAFVTSLSLVSEAAPAARGRAIGIGNALGTVARATAVVASGRLYDAVGIGGSLGLATGATVLAAVMLALTRP